MRISKVTYQKSFVIGPYLQEKVGVEVDIPEEDYGNLPPSDYETLSNAALDYAKGVVEEWHKKSNPDIASEAECRPFFSEKIPEQQVEKNTPGQIIEAIQKCTELDGDFGLLSYKLLTGNTLIKEAYDTKLKELQP